MRELNRDAMVLCRIWFKWRFQASLTSSVTEKESRIEGRRGMQVLRGRISPHILLKLKRFFKIEKVYFYSQSILLF